MIKPNYEAEQAIAGIIAMDAQNAMPIVTAGLTLDDFFVPEFKPIFATCYKRYKENKPIDFVTIISDVGEEYKQTLLVAAQSTPLIGNLPTYVQLTHERAQKRRAYDKTVELLEAIDGDEDSAKCQEISADTLKCFDSSGGQDTVSAEQGWMRRNQQQT